MFTDVKFSIIEYRLIHLIHRLSSLILILVAKTFAMPKHFVYIAASTNLQNVINPSLFVRSLMNATHHGYSGLRYFIVITAEIIQSQQLTCNFDETSSIHHTTVMGIIATAVE